MPTEIPKQAFTGQKGGRVSRGANLTLYVRDRALWQRAKALAAVRGESLSSFVEVALRRVIEETERCI